MEDEPLFALDYATEQSTPVSVLAPWMPRLVQTVRTKPLTFGLGFAFLLTAIVSLSIYSSNRPTPEDFELRTQAQKLEQQKDWPAALAGFEALARTRRSFASFGRENASRLRNLLDRENSLLADARGQESRGDTSGAKSLYERVAALHGDKEQFAVDAIARLMPLLEPLPTARESDMGPSSGKVKSSGKSQAASRAPARTSGESCQLIPTDVIRHLQRAERDSGNGKYDDAERLYNDVLACEPNNERARTGLEHTRKARAAERNSATSN